MGTIPAMSDRLVAIHMLWREFIDALTSGREEEAYWIDCVLVECLSLADDEFHVRFPGALADVLDACMG